MGMNSLQTKHFPLVFISLRQQHSAAVTQSTQSILHIDRFTPCDLRAEAGQLSKSLLTLKRL